MLTLTRAEGNTWSLNGQVTVDTITGVLPAVQEMLRSGAREVRIDLSKVTRVDSGSIALLLACIRMADKAAVMLKFAHYPQKMLDIMEVSNLGRLFLSGKHT